MLVFSQISPTISDINLNIPNRNLIVNTDNLSRVTADSPRYSDVTEVEQTALSKYFK